MTTPSYLAATTGIAAAAGQANQFLGTHAITYLYAGVQRGAQVTDGGGTFNISSAEYAGLAQQIVTASGQTTLGYLAVYGKAVGNGCDLTASLYTNSSSKPGTQVGSVATTIPADFWNPSAVQAVTFPLPIGGLTASTTYQLVLLPGDVNGNNAGNGSNYIALETSNQTSGGCDGGFGSLTWSTVPYGFMFQAFDGTVTGPLTMIWEDAGARWTWLDWSSGVLAGIYEYTVAQGTGKMRSVRTVTNSGTLPTVVT